MIIQSVGGESCDGKSKKDVITMMKEAGTEVTMVLSIPAGTPPPKLVVLLTKFEGRKMGMSFADTEEGVKIKNVKPGGIADESGRLKPGMKLLSVNGQLFTNKAECVTLIKESPSEVRLEVELPAEAAATEPEEVVYGTTTQFSGNKTKQLANHHKDTSGAYAPVEPDNSNPFGTTPEADKPEADKPKKKKPAAPTSTDSKAKVDYSTMSRLQCIKTLRQRQIDYKSVATDLDGLRNLLTASDLANGGDGGNDGDASEPTSTPTPAVEKPVKWYKEGVTSVSITKVEGRKLGMSFEESPEGVRVKGINPSGLMAEHKIIEVGMLLTSVNGTDVINSRKADCVSIIKAATGTIDFEFKTQPVTSQPHEPETKVPPPPKSPAPAQLKQQSSSGGDEFDGMGRLALIKMLRSNGVDYSGASTIEGLRDLARGASSKPTPKPTPAVAKTPEPTTTSSQSTASPYEGLGRLKLVGLCRKRGIDYSSAGKDMEALKALLVAADGGGGSDTIDVVIDKEGKKLGMSVNSLRGEQIYISKITEGGAIAESGQIVLGMALMAVNGQNVSRVAKSEVVKALKESNNLILTVKNDVAGFKEYKRRKQEEKDAKKDAN